MTKKEALQAMKKAVDCMYNLEKQLLPVSDFIYEKCEKDLKAGNTDSIPVLMLNKIDAMRKEQNDMMNTIKEISQGIEEHIEISEEDDS